MPGDGTVSWSRQTDPPVVLVKYRAKGTPDDFPDFLTTEALVQARNDEIPEHLPPFLSERYVGLAAATLLDPSETYQIATALYEGWVGLYTREALASWEGDHDRLHEVWIGADGHLDNRLGNLPRLVALGRLSFVEAAEFVCSAVRHSRGLPASFLALNTAAYRDYGLSYMVKWAGKMFEQLTADDDDADAESSDGVDPTTDDAIGSMQLIASRFTSELGRDGAVLVGIDDAVEPARAGVSSVEHGMFMGEEATDLMVDSDTYWAPTVSAVREIAKAGVETGIPSEAVAKAEDAAKRSEGAWSHALDADVDITMGIDAGMPFNDRGEDALHEMELLVEYGLSPTEALEAVAVGGADLLGLNDMGKVAEDYVMDLVVLDADSSEDAGARRMVRRVYREGKQAV